MGRGRPRRKRLDQMPLRVGDPRLFAILIDSDRPAALSSGALGLCQALAPLRAYGMSPHRAGEAERDVPVNAGLIPGVLARALDRAPDMGAELEIKEEEVAAGGRRRQCLAAMIAAGDEVREAAANQRLVLGGVLLTARRQVQSLVTARLRDTRLPLGDRIALILSFSPVLTVELERSRQVLAWRREQAALTSTPEDHALAEERTRQALQVLYALRDGANRVEEAGLYKVAECYAQLTFEEPPEFTARTQGGQR